MPSNLLCQAKVESGASQLESEQQIRLRMEEENHQLQANGLGIYGYRHRLCWGRAIGSQGIPYTFGRVRPGATRSDATNWEPMNDDVPIVVGDVLLPLLGF